MKSDYDFEPTKRPNEPLFAFDWQDAIILGAMIVFFIGILGSIM